MTDTAAIVGGGVIGGGWAARFLLNGWDVRVFDPDAEAARKIGEVLDNARRALPGLSEHALPAEGRLSFHATMSEAVDGARWVQESVPERLELKRKVFQTLQAHCPHDAVIASSTSGFRPSELQACATRPGQILVAHPFNPVYLLPLVELVTTDANPNGMGTRAADILRGLAMYPLHLTREIDAHIADRLLEAVWREALWLIRDGIATTGEIDEAIRMGFGLRWAQMGLFETYRVAGGEAGMRHFMAQFGPCLSEPWTRLMDVPEFTDALVDQIADQSDAQSGAHTIRELERIRDANLVGLMRALKGQNWGAGAFLVAADAARAPAPHFAAEAVAQRPIDQPLETIARAIPLDWSDYNGHMTESRYLQVFGDATDRFMTIVGCDADYIAAGTSFFTAESHIRHLAEAHPGDSIRVTTRFLGGEGAKMHLFHEMRRGDTLLATGEHFLLHVSLDTRRPVAPEGEVAARLAAVARAHAALPRPDGAGRHVGQRT